MERSFIHVVSLQMSTGARAGPGRSQETETTSGSPTGVAGAHLLLFSHAHYQKAGLEIEQI